MNLPSMVTDTDFLSVPSGFSTLSVYVAASSTVECGMFNVTVSGVTSIRWCSSCGTVVPSVAHVTVGAGWPSILQVIEMVSPSLALTISGLSVMSAGATNINYK